MLNIASLAISLFYAGGWAAIVARFLFAGQSSDYGTGIAFLYVWGGISLVFWLVFAIIMSMIKKKISSQKYSYLLVGLAIIFFLVILIWQMTQ